MELRLTLGQTSSAVLETHLAPTYVSCGATTDTTSTETVFALRYAMLYCLEKCRLSVISISVFNILLN